MIKEPDLTCTKSSLLEFRHTPNAYSGKSKMGTSVTLEMIYEEVKRVNERLKLIEDTIEEIIIRGLPKIELNKEKIKEIERSIKEMKKGNYATLEEPRVPNTN
jgi:hypothetical protein